MDFPLALCSHHDHRAAQKLIESSDLCFEADFDELIGVFRHGRLAACGARAGRVLKMLVVAPEFRGEGLIADIIVELMRLGREAGNDGFFIFSRRCAAAAFARLGFNALVEYNGIIWLEYGNGLSRYLAERCEPVRSGNNTALLLRADPLNAAELDAIECAARSFDHVYTLLCVEGKDLRSALSTRLELVRHSVAHLSNVTVTDSSHYWLQAESFPGYFLRPDDDREAIMNGLQEQLFERHFSTAFQLRSWQIVSTPKVFQYAY